MISKLTLSLIAAAVAVQLQAVTIENTAGGLSSRITDTGIATLTVTGTMDAYDFYFIADNLDCLTTVDLSGVEVVPGSVSLRYGQRAFAAGELPAGAFAGKKALASIALPSGLKVIGDAAFAGCTSISAITLPASVTSIGEYAFAGCTSLTDVMLPASVEQVGAGAFMRCTSLKSLTAASGSRLASIGEGALMDCPALTAIDLGTSLQAIGERALAGSGVGELDLTASKGLTAVDAWAMAGSQATSVKLPATLSQLGDGAFLYATRLENVTLGSKLGSLNDYTLAGTALATSPQMGGMSAVGDYAMYNVSALSVVELPTTITWLGSRSMAGMTGLAELKSNAANVPALGENVWDGVNQGAVLLYVPASARDSYAAAEQWKEFLFGSTWLKGDVNLDGEVNIADVNAILNIIMGGRVDADTMKRADVNEDGEVNIADVNAVLNIIFGTRNILYIDREELATSIPVNQQTNQVK